MHANVYCRLSLAVVCGLLHKIADRQTDRQAGRQTHYSDAANNVHGTAALLSFTAVNNSLAADDFSLHCQHSIQSPLLMLRTVLEWCEISNRYH